MFDYTGYECCSCGEKFTADDDIVVCPECGTPYHRQCYLKEGRCINDELHEKKISWRSANSAAADAVKCSKCGNTLGKEQLYCDKCGTPTEYYKRENGINEPKDVFSMNENGEGFSGSGQKQTMENLYPYMINYTDPLCGFNPDEDYGEGVTLKDIGDFVGTNTHYYLPKFRTMKLTGFKLSLNIPAMLFPEIYFANRRMPLLALLVLILKTIINIPSAAASMQMMLEDSRVKEMMIQAYPFLSEAAERISELDLYSGFAGIAYNLSNILSWVVLFVCAGFANYFYYRHILSKSAKIKAEAEQMGLNCSTLLRASGGTSAGLMILFIVLYFIMQYVSIAAVALFI